MGTAPNVVSANLPREASYFSLLNFNLGNLVGTEMLFIFFLIGNFDQHPSWFGKGAAGEEGEKEKEDQ